MRTLTSPRLFVSLFLVTALSATACSDDDAPAAGPPADDADVIEYELFPTTRQLTEADLATLTAANDDGTLAFSSEPAALAGVQPGHVVLGPISAKTPSGLLRAVTAIERDAGGNALVLYTVAVPPQVAFKKLHARVKRPAEPFVPSTNFVVKDMTPMALRPSFTVATGRGERQQSYQFVVYDGDGDVSTRNDQIVIDATLGGGFTYALEVSVDWGGITDLPRIISECIASIGKIVVGEKPKCSIDDLLPEAKTTFNVDPFVTIDVDARGAAALEFEKELEIGTIDLPPYPVGPLVFTPTVDVVAKVGGGASARFDVGVKARADLESSVSLSSKSLGSPQYSPPRLKDHSVDPREPTLDLHARAEAKVGARLGLNLYGIAGPYATVSGVASIEASPLKDPCWSLRFALESELGLRIRPRLPFIGYVNIADFKAQPFRPFDEEVAKGSCIIPPDPPQAPGSGPTPSKIATPSFTPWAKLVGGSVDGASSDTGTFILAAPELVPSIDGRYVAAGLWAFGLHKIDGDGALTWTSTLATPNDRALRALRSVPTRDAGLMALVEPPDTAAFVLAKTGQSGAIAWTRSYALSNECIPRPLHMMNDSAAGFLVFGDCAGGDAWMVHVDANGDVVRASIIREDGSARIRPTVGTRNNGEIILGGEVARPGELEWTFVSRLGADDVPGVSTAFHCPDRIVMQPTSMIPAEDGGVTVVGAANGPGFVARVRKDGTLGFARFPNRGLGVASEFIVQSVAELSTTGMVISASTRNVSEPDPPSVIVAGLDSGGSTLWSKRYAITAPAPRSLATPALRLTDDGGVVVTAIAGAANGREGDLYAMKVFTKDGFLGDGMPITSSPVVLEDFACTMATRPFAPKLTNVAVTVAPTDLKRR